MKNKTQKSLSSGLEKAWSNVLFVYFLVVLGFKDKSVAQMIIDARDIVSKMTGNPNFNNPNPSLADVTAAIDALEVAEENMNGSRANTIIRNIRLKEFKQKMKGLQSYVENMAMGNPEVVISSGFEVRKPNKPVGILPATEWVKGKNGAADGSIDLKWKAVKKSSGYRVEGTTNPSEGWPMVYESEKASISIYDLQPGVKYYFRIATLSHAGYEGYSAVFAIRVNLPLD